MVLVSKRLRVSMLVVSLRHITVFFSLENCIHIVSIIYGATTVFGRDITSCLENIWCDILLVRVGRL